MEELSCPVCRIDYDENETLPKVLPCGHSVCRSCLTKILDGNPLCPKCRTCLDNSFSDDYPTNFALLSMSSAHASLNLLKCHLESRIVALKVKSKLIERKDALTKKKSEICSNLEFIKNSLSRLESFILAENEDINLTEANCVLREIEEDFAKVKNVTIFSHTNFRISVNISLQNFDSPCKYLEEMYKMLLKGEQIYSVSTHENNLKYGKISIQDNMIIVHALCLSSLPDNVEAVWFDDFKKCVNEENFKTFLKFSCKKGINRMVIIKMEDSSLVPQFARLCTGECDAMYKGCPFIRGDYSGDLQPILAVEKYKLNEAEKRGIMDYGVSSWSQPRKLTYDKGDVILIGYVNGSFKIVKCCNSVSLSNIIGTVTSPSNLSELNFYDGAESLTIVDSGIVFEF